MLPTAVSGRADIHPVSTCIFADLYNRDIGIAEAMARCILCVGLLLLGTECVGSALAHDTVDGIPVFDWIHVTFTGCGPSACDNGWAACCFMVRSHTHEAGPMTEMAVLPRQPFWRGHTAHQSAI